MARHQPRSRASWRPVSCHLDVVDIGVVLELRAFVLVRLNAHIPSETKRSVRATETAAAQPELDEDKHHIDEASECVSTSAMGLCGARVWPFGLKSCNGWVGRQGRARDKDGAGRGGGFKVETLVRVDDSLEEEEHEVFAEPVRAMALDDRHLHRTAVVIVDGDDISSPRDLSEPQQRLLSTILESPALATTQTDHIVGASNHQVHEAFAERTL